MNDFKVGDFVEFKYPIDSYCFSLSRHSIGKIISISNDEEEDYPYTVEFIDNNTFNKITDTFDGTEFKLSNEKEIF